jgi:hypothetical protein
LQGKIIILLTARKIKTFFISLENLYTQYLPLLFYRIIKAIVVSLVWGGDCMAALWLGLLLLYLLILYILLFPGLVQFLFEPHRWEKKVLQFFVSLVVPFFLPFALALLLSWWALVACFAFGFMLVAFPIYWLIVHLPGRVAEGLV